MSANEQLRLYQHNLIRLEAQNKLRLLCARGEDPYEVCERYRWGPESRVAVERELDGRERQQQEGGLPDKPEAPSDECFGWGPPKMIDNKSEEGRARNLWWPPKLCLHRSDFCEECRHIQFEQAWSLKPRYYERNTELYEEKIKDSEGVEWLVNSSKCHFCRYLVNARRCRSGTPDAGMFHIRLSTRLGSLVHLEDHGSPTPRPSQVHIRVSYPPIDSIESTRVTLNTIVCHAGEPTRLACVPQIIPPVLDISLAKSWLEACKKRHPECAKEDDLMMPETRLIDCHTRELISVGPRDNCRRPFVALSYVWGPNPNETIELIDGGSQHLQLPEKVPRTIEDAITITKSLGFDFLWVDQFCIDQHDEEDQKRQIRHMDLIYKCADLTIIAAAGENREYGLPGVTNPRKHVLEPFILETGPSQLQLTFGIFPRRKGPRQNGSWHTRGWTFQEALLSRRRLVFSESKMHFECKCHGQIQKEEYGGGESAYIDNGGIEKLNESGDYQTICGKITLSTPLKIETNTVAHKGLVESLVTYIELAMQYTTRQLSFAKDGLNAFHGVANSLQRFDKPVYSIAGIPFVENRGEDNLLAEAAFSTGLSWHSIGGKMADASASHNTDDEFPSWSWGNTQLWNVTWNCDESLNNIPPTRYEQDLYGLDTDIISGLGDLRVDFVDGDAQWQLSLAEFAEACRGDCDSNYSTLPTQWKARALRFKACIASPYVGQSWYRNKSDDTFKFLGSFFADFPIGPSSFNKEFVSFVAHGNSGPFRRSGEADHHTGWWDCEYANWDGKLRQEILTGGCGFVLLCCAGEHASVLVVQWLNDANESPRIARRSGILSLDIGNHLDNFLRCFSSGVDLTLV